MDSVIDLTGSEDDSSLSEDKEMLPDTRKVHVSRHRETCDGDVSTQASEVDSDDEFMKSLSPVAFPKSDRKDMNSARKQPAEANEPRSTATHASEVDSDDEFMKSLSPVAFPKSDRKDMNSARKQPAEANEPRSTATLAALKPNPMVSSCQKPSNNDDSSEDSDDVSIGYESPDADIELPEIALRVGDEIIYRCRTDIYLWKKRKIRSIDLNNRRFCLTMYGDYPLEKTHMVRLPWMDKSRRVEDFKLIEGVGPPPPESELARRFRLARGEVQRQVDRYWQQPPP